tara:strand:- start:281 stop:526 length:246 start_codon:yes stop_codon:yes gene_type:complete
MIVMLELDLLSTAVVRVKEILILFHLDLYLFHEPPLLEESVIFVCGSVLRCPLAVLWDLLLAEFLDRLELPLFAELLVGCV